MCELPHLIAYKHSRNLSFSILSICPDSAKILPAYAPSVLRRGTSRPLRVRLCLALRLAEPKLSFAERRLVEVRGVEPLSETALPEHLRVYPAIDLGRGMPTGGLIPIHPFGSAPCSVRAENPAAWPARLCLGAQQTSALRHRGRYLGGETVIVVRNYSFSSFFNVANENPRRATRPQRIPSKPDHPHLGWCAYYTIIPPRRARICYTTLP